MKSILRKEYFHIFWDALLGCCLCLQSYNDFLLNFHFEVKASGTRLYHRCQRHRQTFIAGYNDTGEHPMAGFVDTGGKHKDANIYAKFRKIRNGPEGARGKLIHEKNLKSKISWKTPFKHLNTSHSLFQLILVYCLTWRLLRYNSSPCLRVSAVRLRRQSTYKSCIKEM